MTTDSNMSNRNHIVLNLYGDQIRTYLTARAAVIHENGPDVSEGEIVAELADAYVDGDTFEVDTLCQMVTETAAQNGDPVFTRDELETMDIDKLRTLAGKANTDIVSGKGCPKHQLIAYFSCPYPSENDGST